MGQQMPDADRLAALAGEVAQDAAKRRVQVEASLVHVLHDGRGHDGLGDRGDEEDAET